MTIQWNSPKIKSGSLDILTSGSFLFKENSVASLYFKDDNSTEGVKFNMQFITNDGGDSLVNMKIGDLPGIVDFTFININTLIYGTTDIVELPFTIDENKLFLAFYITSLDIKTIRLFNYTIYISGV